MDASGEPQDGQETRPGTAAARRGRTPWLLTLLLTAGLVVLFAGLILLTVDPERFPALLSFASPTAVVTSLATPTLQPVATAGPTVRPALPASLRFALDPAAIEYVPRAGRCDWSGVAGRVERGNGEGLPGLRIHVKHAGSALELSAITDASGNFELRLGDVPLLAPWQVQLQNAAGAPLSDVTQIVTSERCDQNLVVIIFSESG